MESVIELLKSISSENDTCTSSKKDEVRVMRAVMNDTTYSVGVYGNEGKKDEFNPSVTFREVCASVISGAAKIPANEANALIKDYEFKRSDAERMVEFSKEFVNTYLHTGRKLPLGGRASSNISLALKPVPAGERMLVHLAGGEIQPLQQGHGGERLFQLGRAALSVHG